MLNMKCGSPRLLLAMLAACFTPAMAKAQSFPARPITVVVPSAPGGTTDFAARLAGEYMSRELVQSLVIENIGGASGNIGNTRVARASPDGYTLLMSYSGYHVANPHLFKIVNWDPLKSYTPIGLALKAPHVILIAKKLPVTDLASFKAYAKANAGKLNYASSGPGSIQHIGGEQLKLAAGLDMAHVPYRGAGPAMNDLLAGTVDLFITTPPSAVGHLQAGTVKGLAMADAKRHPMLPDLPTTAEAGLPGYELVAWFGLFGPAGLDPDIAKRLTSALAGAVANPEYVKRSTEQGAYPSFLPPAELQRLVTTELEHWGKVIRAAKIVAE